MSVRMLMGTVAVAALSALCIRVVSDASRAAQEAANRAMCVGHLKKIILGLYEHHATYGTFPPGTVPHSAQPPARRLGWPVSVLGFFGGGVDPGIDETRGGTSLRTGPSSTRPRRVSGTLSAPRLLPHSGGTGRRS
jgi:hypothetical protein